MKKLTLALLISLFTYTAHAATPASTGQQAGGPAPSRGWFFFEDPKKDEKPEDKPIDLSAPAPQQEQQTPPPPKSDTCKKKDTWTPDCGFIDPGKDFDFQAKQRDALLENMVVSKNDPKAVEGFQYYMRWALGRVSEVANVWQYNMLQNPELDPTAKAPVSTMGLRLITDVKEGKDTEIFKLIKSEGGMFVYFSRSDCAACHEMSYVINYLKEKTGIPVENASLDATCDSAFSTCLKGDAVSAPAAALKVSVVPAIFLYIRPNTWIRVSNGYSDATTVKARTVQFFQAYRTALLNGTQNGDGTKPSVDFSSNGDMYSVSTPSGSKVQLPSQDQLEKMIGK